MYTKREEAEGFCAESWFRRSIGIPTSTYKKREEVPSRGGDGEEVDFFYINTSGGKMSFF